MEKASKRDEGCGDSSLSRAELGFAVACVGEEEGENGADDDDEDDEEDGADGSFGEEGEEGKDWGWEGEEDEEEELWLLTSTPGS